MKSNKKTILLMISLMPIFLLSNCVSVQEPLDVAILSDSTAQQSSPKSEKQQSESVAKRFQESAPQKPTVVESAMELSQKHALLSEQTAELRRQNKELTASNQQLKEQVVAIEAKLQQAQKELTEANDILIAMRIELNNWKLNILGFRDEMRDAETIATALRAAASGHLVFSTFHTTNAMETISGIVNYFEPHQQPQIRTQLAANLVSVISQRLIRRKDGAGRILAAEVMAVSSTIKSCIQDPEKNNQIPRFISQGRIEYGMQTFDQAIFKLYKDGLISYDDAIQAVTNPDEFKLRLVGIEQTAERGWGQFEKKDQNK